MRVLDGPGFESVLLFSAISLDFCGQLIIRSFILGEQPHMSSGKYTNIAITAPLYHWNGGNFFISLLKDRTSVKLLLKNLTSCNINTISIAYVLRRYGSCVLAAD